MAIQQISVFAANQPGSLSKVIDALENANIDLRALSVAETVDFGIVRIIANNPEKAADALRAAGCLFRTTNVAAVKVPDTPGSLKKLLGFMNKHNVNIEYMYAFLMPTAGNACMVMRVDNVGTIDSLLASAGFDILTEGNMD